jgi:YD repeat-containing protein
MKRLVAPAVFLLAACAVLAANNPDTAKGFQPGQLYQFGDLSRVNVFNGNLNLSLPIGQRYPVGGNLAYGLTLSYAGNNWGPSFREKEVPDENGILHTKLFYHMNPTAPNAGIGWYLSAGGHLSCVSPTVPVSTWTYTTADSAEYDFSASPSGSTPDPAVRHSESGTYMRLKEVPCGDGDPCRDVEFPDGTIHRFKALGGIPLVGIRDLLGNSVTVAITPAPPLSGLPPTPPVWQFTDNTGRVQTVTFERLSAPVLTQPGDEPKVFDVVKTVQLTAFGGTTATYTFHYSPGTDGSDNVTLIQRPLITGDCQCNDSEVNPSLYVPILTSVTLPDGSSYGMTYNDGITTDRSLSGSIASLTLPTLGKHEWTYQSYVFPAASAGPLPPPGGMLNFPDNLRYSTGLLDEIVKDSSGNPLRRTHYDTQPNRPDVEAATTLRNTVSVFASGTTETLLSSTVHYFSLNLATTLGYGLPFTTDSAIDADPALIGEQISTIDSVGGKTRHLSTKTYDGAGHLLTYSYLSYEGFSVAGYFDGARVDSEKVFYRNPVDFSLISSTTDSTDFDGYGHYRTVTTSGSGFVSGTSNTRTVTTNYNKPDAATGGTLFDTGTLGTSNVNAISSSSPWLLNMYSSITASEGASVHKSLFSFNTSNGFLERTRTLVASALDSNGEIPPGPHDLVGRYTPDAAGNVQLEESFGGDLAAIDTSPLAAMSLSNRQYAQFHLYSFGNLSKTSYIDPLCSLSPQTSCPSVLTVVDNAIDYRTGLPAVSRDVSGLSTAFQYDTSGRLTSVAPPGMAQTSYTYTNAIPNSNGAATPASVAAEAAIGTTTDGLKSIYTYDSFGRLVQEATVANDMTRYRSTTYDAIGRKVTESTLGVLLNPHVTTFSYDALNRVISVTQPDGTVTSFDRTSEPATTKQTVKVFTNAGDTDAVTTTELDRQNRLFSVQEPNGTVTTHTYDVADHLTSVTMPGEGVIQHRYFNYDGRGFLLSEQHPELGIDGDGTTTYSGYDARGHVHNKLTGPPGGTYDLRFNYDAAERLISISDSGASHPLKVFTFGDSNGTGTATDFRQGKLLTATRYNKTAAPLSGDIVTTETYQYVTPSGRPSERDTEVKSGSTTIQSFQQMFSYDTLGAVTAPGYPTCLNVTCSIPTLTTATNVYTNGLLTSVQGFGTLSYNANGTLGQVAHAGNTGVNVFDTITPDDSGMPRPKSIDYSGWTTQTCTGPSTPSIAAQSTRLGTSNQGTTLTASATGCGTLSYQWYSGLSGDASVPLGTSAIYATGALQSTTNFWVKATDSSTNTSANSATTVITVCDPAVITVQPQGTSPGNDLPPNNQGMTLTVGATGCGVLSYQWYRGNMGDTSDPVQGTTSSYSTGPLTSTTSFWVRVTDSTGPTQANSSTASVSVSTSCVPHITEQPADQTVDYLTPVNVHVTVTGCTGKVYMWYSGLTGDTTNPLLGGIYSTPSISGVFDHGPIWVQISGNAITTVNSAAAMISVRPISVNAHVTSGTNIGVTWAAHAHHYVIRRCANGACAPLSASPTSLSYTDSTGSANTAYVYSVASVDVYGNTSLFSAPDLATTMTFTPVQQNFVINRTHINELLTAVNLVRAAAGLTAVTWSAILPAGVPAPPPAGQATVPIYAAHITSLRTQMDLALAALLIPRPPYTDTLTTPTPIKAIHFTELQSRTQ